MKRWLQSPWTAATVGTVIFLATLVLAWRPQAAPPAQPPPAPASKPAANGLAGANPELDLLVEELNRQKETLAAKEKQLNELATRLQNEKTELCQLTQTVHQIQTEFDQNITRVREEESSNVKKLAKMYSAMSPDGAAAIFKSLDDTTLVKVLTCMKDAERSPILELLARQSGAEAKRVANLSERLRLTVTETKK